MKISKASWMILGAGIFIILLAALGMTRSGQMKEYDRISGELSTAEMRAGNLQTGQFQTQINELEEQLKDAASQAAEAKEKLKQTVTSVDVADKFYEIADYYGVTVLSVSTTSISEQPYESIGCETISLSTSVTGSLEDIIDFIIGLNNNYVTGFVRSVALSIADYTGGSSASASLQMVVYSRKGS